MIIVFSISENTTLKKWLTDKAKKENVHINTVIRNILEEYSENDRQAS